MNLLLLPGNNPRHREWLLQVEQELSPLFNRTLRHEYRHWQTGEPEIDLAYESSQLIDKTVDLEPYIIFAKSAGTLLSLQAMEQGILQPTACLFAGIPLPMTEQYGLPLERWLQTVTVPVHIMQNSADPFGSASQIDRKSVV